MGTGLRNKAVDSLGVGINGNSVRMQDYSIVWGVFQEQGYHTRPGSNSQTVLYSPSDEMVETLSLGSNADVNAAVLVEAVYGHLKKKSK